MSEDIVLAISKRRELLMVLAGCLALLVSLVIFGVAHNAFGRNLHGEVYCANGKVTGVYVEASRLSRVGGLEVQSGFAHWQSGPEQNAATFNYWLKYGGTYSIHFGCMPLDGVPGGWGTDNRTPVSNDDDPQWWCDNPANTRPPAVIVTVCRSN